MEEKNPAGGERGSAPVTAEPVPQRHVLVVEDEELVAMSMVDELKLAGWTVVGPATSLEEAQALVVSGVKLDAAILDIHLRGRWVHSLAEQLKSLGVPFVVCSGYEVVDPDGRFADAPLIAKPIAPHRLGATLDALLSPAEPLPSPIQPGAD